MHSWEDVFCPLALETTFEPSFWVLDLVSNPKSSKKSLRKPRCSTILFFLYSNCIAIVPRVDAERNGIGFFAKEISIKEKSNHFHQSLPVSTRPFLIRKGASREKKAAAPPAAAAAPVAALGAQTPRAAAVVRDVVSSSATVWAPKLGDDVKGR